MTIFHCYVCDNVDHRLIALHKEACSLAKIKTKYHTFKINEILKEGLSPHQKHGWFMGMAKCFTCFKAHKDRPI
jgi:hypothetical protein